MKRSFLILPLFAILYLWTLVACEPKRLVAPFACYLVGANEQTDQNGRLSGFLERSFTYAAGQLTSVTERNTNRQGGFRIEYNRGNITRATDPENQQEVTFEYTELSDKPYRATLTRAGQLQTVYAMEYTPTGKLSRIIENRQVIPSGATIIERTFSMNYDVHGNITLEQAQVKLRSGATAITETEYTFDDQPSPYADVPQPVVLTVIALTQGVESLPGRFWNENTFTGYTTYSVAANGTRTRREAVTIISTRDKEKKLTSQEQTTLSYLTSQTNPTSSKTQHTFVYQCRQ